MQNTKLAMFLMIFSVLSNFFAYTFTSFAIDYGDVYVGDMDKSDLYTIGILLGDNDVHNVTFNGGMVNYDLQNGSYFRIEWAPHWYEVAPLDTLKVWKRTTVLGFNYWVVETCLDADYGLVMNSTIIDGWSSTWNWTRITTKSGFELFIQPRAGTNITQAVLIDGALTITMAENLEISNDLSVVNFVNWFVSIATGTQTFGLPRSLSIFVWILNIIGIFGAVLMIKEMLRV